MLDLLLAISPILVIIILLFVFKRPMIISAPITFLYTLALALFNIQGILPITWAMQPSYALAATIKGVVTAIDITIIIFGAIFFLEFLKETKLMQNIEYYLGTISHDKRVQGIILTWFLCSFIEGTAGFGTPAAIVAPLLVAIGFMPVTAVAISLIADSTAVAFGAVGTPITIGLSTLDVTGVAFYTALINMIVGLIVPIAILVVIVLANKKERSWQAIKEMIPFSLWAGIVLLVPYFLSSFIGQEFPSLVGPLVGLAIIIYTTKKGFLVPKNVWKFKDSKIKLVKEHGKFKTFLPYVLLIIFLVIGKYTLPKFGYSIIDPIKHSVNLFNPGLIFIITILIFSLFYRKSFEKIGSSMKESARILIKPFIAILFIVAFVQIMVNTNLNLNEIPSMLTIISNYMKTSLLPLIAPLIGGFGAFISGSATVSNIFFGEFQFQTAQTLGISTAIILALQTIGAGVGNMISLTNIVAAQATVKLHDKEAEIIKRTIIPFLVYVLLAGIIGMIIISI